MCRCWVALGVLLGLVSCSGEAGRLRQEVEAKLEAFSALHEERRELYRQSFPGSRIYDRNRLAESVRRQLELDLDGEEEIQMLHRLVMRLDDATVVWQDGIASLRGSLARRAEREAAQAVE